MLSETSTMSNANENAPARPVEFPEGNPIQQGERIPRSLLQGQLIIKEVAYATP